MDAKDRQISRLKHQRCGLQRTIFEMEDKIILQNEIIKDLREINLELMCNSKELK